MSLLLPVRFTAGGGFPAPWPDSTQWVYEKSSAVLTKSWEALDFSPDGTKMYMVRNQAETNTTQWPLSTPWDIATLGARTVVAALGKTNCTGVRVRVDNGSSLYTIQDNGAVEYGWQFSISNYDITGGTVAASRNLGGFSTTLDGLFIKPDGTRLFWLEGSTVVQLTMTTPWAINTAGTKVTKAIPASGKDLFFHPSGLQMFTLGGASLRDYTMTTAWDISTLALNSTTVLPGSRTDQTGLYIREDGLKLYCVRYIQDTVIQYKKVGT